MATKGLRYPVFAKITAETDGSAITYGTGKVLCAAVQADMTENRRDNPLYADDIRKENDKGLTDYSISFTGDEISLENRAEIFGYKAVTSGTVTHYVETAASTPYVGFGYIIVKQSGSTTRYQAMWYYKVQFSPSGEGAQTMKEQIEWQTEQINGTGIPVYIDGSGDAAMRDIQEFTTAEAAKAWLNNYANIT